MDIAQLKIVMEGMANLGDGARGAFYAYLFTDFMKAFMCFGAFTGVVYTGWRVAKGLIFGHHVADILDKNADFDSHRKQMYKGIEAAKDAIKEEMRKH